MSTLPSSADVIAAHDAALATDPVAPTAADVHGWIAVNHFHNRSLWAQEDLARRTQAPDAEIVANKRAIDRHNQARNDAIERVDEFLLSALGLVDPATIASALPRSTVPAGARLNSETAGSMLDRISILGLKIAAMREQTLRTDVDDAHRQACTERLQRLIQQRTDLGSCYDELLADARAGRAYFKVYRQFKMYNDPRLNPALVAEGRTG
ncbi:MAG: DUF4254 domain-containing protein [Roseateles sp.]|nr:MAG: DUF4254 domain-containing protein [Roseateles sp.]